MKRGVGNFRYRGIIFFIENKKINVISNEERERNLYTALPPILYRFLSIVRNDNEFGRDIVIQLASNSITAFLASVLPKLPAR